MYEIIDKASEQTMYIHIPYSQRSDCKMMLDRFNWEKEYGECYPRITLIHKDGDYRNCEVENLYPVPIRAMRRLKKLISDFTCSDAIEFGIAVYELISKVNELKGYDFYASKVCEINRQNDAIKHEHQKQRRRIWYQNNIDHIRAYKRAANARLRATPEGRKAHNERNKKYYAAHSSDPQFREAIARNSRNYYWKKKQVKEGL